VYLQPLGTEGQGFYLGRKKYNLTQFAIPFGGGIKFAFNDNVRIKLEVGLRKLMTDYLDDVSTTFAPQAALLANNGQRAVDFSFRGDELKPGLTYPTANTKRGNPSSKDWYYFSGVTLSIRLVNTDGSSFLGKTRSGCKGNF
jgi:hypothetical protein